MELKMTININFPLKVPGCTEHWDLKHWQKCFKIIFYKKNREIRKDGYKNNRIAFTRGYIISHLAQDLGTVAENIREHHTNELKTKSIPSIFAWLLAFANEFEFDLADIIYKKIPGYCKYCGKSLDCEDAWWSSDQLASGKKPNKKRRKNQTEIKQPTTFACWIQMINTIYGSKYKLGMTLYDIMYKLQEEHAEILEELDKMKKNSNATRDLKSEVADFISWMFALIIKLELYGFLDTKQVIECLSNKFEHGCKKCGTDIKPNCTCPISWL